MEKRLPARNGRSGARQKASQDGMSPLRRRGTRRCNDTRHERGEGDKAGNRVHQDPIPLSLCLVRMRPRVRRKQREEQGSKQASKHKEKAGRLGYLRLIATAALAATRTDVVVVSEPESKRES